MVAFIEQITLYKCQHTLIIKNDFIINETKVYLADKSNRQFVTGLVVNEKVNINRKFIRNIRPVINSLKKDNDFRKEYLKTNKKDILIQLRGKIEFIGYIRGYDDPLYRKYALELSKIDPSYIFNRRNLSFGDGKLIEIYCEGVTDYLFLKRFLAHFKKIGLFTELEINFREDSKFTGGDTQLLDAYKKAIQMDAKKNSYLRIFLFDKDNMTIVNYFKDNLDGLDDLKPLFLPCPNGFENLPYCIENLFNFNDILTICDEENRRLFFKSEFNEKGFHKEDQLIYLHMKNKQTLVAEEDVLDLNTQKSRALSKSKFAELASTKYLESIDLKNFERTFEEIVKLKNIFYGL